MKKIAFTAMIGLALVAMFLDSTRVGADGEPPATPTETATEVVPPFVETLTEVAATGVSVTTEEPAQPEPISTETPIATEAISATDTPTAIPSSIPVTPTDTAISEETPLLETVQQIPAEMDVVVLDENGQPLPLVSQDAAEVIATGDPIWCPDGVAPIPGKDGCTSSFPTLSELVKSTGGLSSGTVWITSGLVADVSPVNIYGWGNLTLQGGWSGTPGDTTIGSNSVFSGTPISVFRPGSITINNITFDNSSPLTVNSNGGSVTLNNTILDNGSPLTINYSANVTLNNSTLNHESPLTIDNINYGTNVTLNSVNIIRSPGSRIWTSGTITINNSNFNNHSYDETPPNWGLNVASPNITIRDSSFDYSKQGLIVNAWGNVEIINSHFDNNSVGVWIWFYPSSNVTIKNSVIKYNYVGFIVACQSPAPSAKLTLNQVKFINNGYKKDFSYCPTGITYTTIGEQEKTDTVISADSQAEISLNCSETDIFTILLPNGDRVTLVCPVGGKARISRLDNTTLPADLPEGYTYVSGFDLEIIQDIFQGTLASVITGDGFMKASFDPSSIQTDATYSILYWDGDQKTWIPLKEFVLNENGTPRIFDLKPGDPDNQEKLILSGVKLDKTSGYPRVQVTTNFPGIFVLAQY